jgi:adenine-specific DNA-methyltransferase
MSRTALEKFQQLLRELFEFDLADLDFGIYRIMNYKRRVIERWIQEDLPKAIKQELEAGALAKQAQTVKELEAARQKVLEALGEHALDAAGNLVEEYRHTKAGKDYITALQKSKTAQSTDALETAVYNHLHTFFSRYWQEGDFISKRRYSKKERYAVPYNGEEVTLYWANHDQYYVKTGEYFTDYSYKAPNGVTVHFKLKAADVEQNNVKGEKRFFLPMPEEMTWDEATRTLVLPFQFRPLTDQEDKTYGQRNQQEAIIARALDTIPKQLSPKDHGDALVALSAEKQRADGSTISLLEHHLRQYTARNTRDFFIHKDLRGFLTRELDFYLKNEVLNLDELEAAGEDLGEGWFQLMRLIRHVGSHLIDFLAQIEDFQKMLWEKKKFVTETFYVITVGNMPEDFYAEIARNEAQWQEWRTLFGIEPPSTPAGEDRIESGVAFLRAHPTLPLDTRHFSPDFTDRLLASFDNLDEITDGLLVHSENWQALNLLLEKYRERVKTIYIDPPYNTGNDGFLYRDNYQHANWLTMMYDRLALGREWIQHDGSNFISIDDGEQGILRGVTESIFGSDNFVNNVIWQKKFSPQNDARWLSDNHDFILCFARDKNIWKPGLLSRAEKQNARYKNPDNDPRGTWMSSGLDVKTYSAEYDYEITTPSGRVVRPPKGTCWRVSKDRFQQLVADNRIWFGPKGNGVPRIKRFLSEVKQGVTPLTLWTHHEVGHNQEGAQELKSMMRDREVFFTSPKPTRLIKRVITVGSENQGVILDYFAGSGTTGHAVINLNREDGGRRKFILVEMANYFDTVLLPRIKKVTFTPEWKDGRPKRMATKEEFERSPRLVKVIRLESYENALNNITFDETSGQQALQIFGEEYMLRYMLRWEGKQSATLLDVEKLQSPFSYKLHIHRDGETREQPVDLPETFNHLIGLEVEKRQALDDGGRRYLIYLGSTRDGRRTSVIWRETAGWTEEDYRRDRDFVVSHKLVEGVDEIYVNGDSLIPGARSLDGVFKAKMFGQES